MKLPLNFKLTHKWRFLPLVIGLLIVQSCYYDVEEVLYGGLECTTLEMSMAADVRPILQNHCMSCHNAGSNFGNVNLEGHANLKKYVDNGKLLGAINHQSGFSPMPQGNPKLSQCQIDKIAAWIEQGSLNN